MHRYLMKFHLEMMGASLQFLILLSSGFFLHDVWVWRVEGESRRGEAVGDQVDPEQLHGVESVGQSEEGGDKDADDFANVGRNQVVDEGLGLVATFMLA